MSVEIFLDTNILIYAYDFQAEIKHDTAKEIVSNCWQHGGALISTQVLQEFYVNLTRKIPQPLSLATARRLVEQYLVWPMVINTPQSTIKASEIQERYRLSFWDSLILSAAKTGGARKLISEDLSHHQTIEGMLIENPFQISE
ncbi:MAG: PIN domain-containing protein [Thermodesulfobacteriota bacterium]